MLGNTVIEKIGSKDGDKIPALVSNGGYNLHEGIYLVDSLDIGKHYSLIYSDSIPVTIIKPLLYESECCCSLFGENFTEMLCDEDEDFDWDAFVLDCIRAIIDVIQGVASEESSIKRRLQFRYGDLLNEGGEPLCRKIREDPNLFKKVCRDGYDPILPDPSRSRLIPRVGNSNWLVDGALLLYDVSSMEEELSSRIVRISTEEDINRWKGCFEPFFKIVWKGYPCIEFDATKGIPAGNRVVGPSKTIPLQEYTYIDATGNQRTISVRMD